MTNIKLLIAVIGLATLIFGFGNFALATVFPSYDNQTDCRGCHGQDVSTRHHTLVVNGTFQCTDCHPIIYDNVTQTYYPEVIRDCLVCHPNKNHTQVHHILVSQGLFVCSDCHPVVYDNQTQSYSVQVTWDCPVCHSTVLSIQNGSNITPIPTSTNNTPSITSFSPLSPVVDLVGDSRTFNITTDQNVNVTWYINNSNSSSEVQFDQNVTESNYTNTSASLGLWNVSAVATNDNGTTTYSWLWNVSTNIIIPPNIIGYAPYYQQMTDYAGLSRKFGIAVDQIANISWYINDNLVQSDIGVSASSYTNSTSIPGTYNVVGIATNSNGSISYSWAWNVIPPVPYIISYDPISSNVSDYVGGSRSFSVTANRTGNVTWYINESNLVQSDNGVTTSSLNFSNIPGTYLGTSNVTAIWVNDYGSDNHSWIWTVMAPVPYITYYDPNSSVVNDTTGSTRNFSIAINQTVNVTWYINNSIIQSNNSVTGANLSFPSISRKNLGTSNVSAIVVNDYGIDINSWIWNVTPSIKTPKGTHAAIDCSVCHPQQNYVTKPQENICYKCHNNASNAANGTNIYKQFTLSNDTYGGMGINKGYYPKVNDRHDITDSDQNYSSSKLECTDCHNAHNASRTNITMNPDNGTNFTGTMIHPGNKQVIFDYVTFCLKCHDNVWPANVIGPSIISNITYWYLMNTTKGDWHGAASGDKYNNTFLIGPYASQAGKNNVPPMPCNDCHDSHGSESLYHLKNLSDEYGVNMTITSTNVNSSDVDHWCSHCHKDPHQKPVVTYNQGNCLSSRCHSHGNRF